MIREESSAGSSQNTNMLVALLPNEPEPEPINPVTRTLTKAEKKALKKRLLRERTARERQQKKKWAG